MLRVGYALHVLADHRSDDALARAREQSLEWQERAERLAVHDDLGCVRLDSTDDGGGDRTDASLTSASSFAVSAMSNGITSAWRPCRRAPWRSWRRSRRSRPSRALSSETSWRGTVAACAARAETAHESRMRESFHVDTPGRSLIDVTARVNAPPCRQEAARSAIPLGRRLRGDRGGEHAAARGDYGL